MFVLDVFAGCISKRQSRLFEAFSFGVRDGRDSERVCYNRMTQEDVVYRSTREKVTLRPQTMVTECGRG